MAKKMKKLLALVLTVAMVLSFMSVGAFAAEPELEPSCGVEAHEHTEACYEKVLKCELGEDAKDLICGKDEHTHGEGCYHVHSEACYTLTCTQSTEPELTCNDAHHKTECLHVCDLACVSALCALSGTYVCDAEHEGHTDECPKHECKLSCVSARCEETGKVVCEEEHEHTDECPKHECTLACVSALCASNGAIVCEEQHEHEDGCSTAHVHTLAECYDTETELCEKVAGETIECEYEEAHAHEDGCYAAHVHGDACHENKLICEKTLHTHTDACYLSVMNEDEDNTPEPITGIITENMTWEDGAVIGGVTIQGNVTITVKGTVTVAGTITPNGVVTFNGENNATLIRGGDFTGCMISAAGANLTVNNITLDGGADWTGEKDKILNRGTTNSGVVATGNILYLDAAEAILNNVVLQNQDGSGESTQAVFLHQYATIEFNNSVVKNNNCNSSYVRGGAITVKRGGTVKTYNADIYGNSAVKGGFFGTSSSKSYGGVVEAYNSKFHNNYADNGAVFDMQCNSKIGYLLIDGCEFYENGSGGQWPAVLGEWSYSRPFIIKNSYFHDNECPVWNCHGDPVLDLSGKIVVKEDADYVGFLFETPIGVGGALADGTVFPLSDASYTKLMTGKKHLMTEVPTDNYYNPASKYTIVASDMEKMIWNDPSNPVLIKTDVDGNGMLDVVPVPNGTTTNVNLYENLKMGTAKESNRLEVQAVSYEANNVPVAVWFHEGFYFTGWAESADGAVKYSNASNAATYADGANLYAIWKLQSLELSLGRKASSGPDRNTLQITVNNKNLEGHIDYTYQWYKDGIAIEGATSDEYTITESATYKCVVTATAEGFAPISDEKSSTAAYVEVPKVYVAQIKETGVKYETLAEAVAVANTMESATIEMLKSIDFDSDAALAINGDVTIIGEYTISRGDYTGTLFTVAADATMTLDGDLTIDGDNEWSYKDGKPVVRQDGNDSYLSDNVEPEAGAPVMEAHMINNYGTLNVNDITIKNSYQSANNSVSLIYAQSNSVTTINGATITHIASAHDGAVAALNTTGAVLTIKGNTSITGNIAARNGGLLHMYGNSCTLNIEGGSIDNNYIVVCGTVICSYSSNANAKNTVNMSGGIITENVAEGYGPVYIHTNSVFNMTGGEISYNSSYFPNYVRNKNNTANISNALIVENDVYASNYQNLRAYYSNTAISTITGGIYDQDVSGYCAAGYVCMPYDRDVSLYCDVPAGYNENTCDDDYIVLPGYRIAYYTLEMNEETQEIVASHVHNDYVLVPKGKTHEEVDLFATPYTHYNSDKTQKITKWYTDKTKTNAFDYATEITQNVNLCSDEWETAILVAKIVETGKTYGSLTEAVAVANTMESATIEMLKSIDFDSNAALAINGDVTIIGEYTISRGDYAGTLFTVAEGASLTLDGGLTIDGGNEWTFDEATYKADRDSRTQVLLADYCTEVDGKLVYKYVTPEAGEPVVADHMILVGAGGIVNLNKVTIKNEYGKQAGVVRVTDNGATVTLDDATITHIASMQQGGVAVRAYGLTVNVVMNDGTVIDGNYVGGNHGLFLLYSNSKMTMNGGQMTNTNGWNSNGVALSVYGGSEFTMNDGLICGNSSIWGQDNPRNMAVNVYANSTVTMNGGMICHNIGNLYAGGIASYKAASNVIISGGRVVYNVSLGNDERYGAERGDDLDTPGAVSLTGGIFGHDVSEWCAPGYVSIPYDQDMSAYCDLSYVTGSAFANDYNEDTCATDYIVVPGYKVSYYAVSTETVKDETTGTETTKLVNTLVHKELLPIPADKTADEVDLFANNKVPYVATNAENKGIIKTWYTKEELKEDKVALSDEYDFETEVLANVNLYGEWKTAYTITYLYDGDVPNGITPPATAYYEAGETVILPETPEVYGYSFTGWATLAPTFAMPPSDMIVSGYWTQNVVYYPDYFIPTDNEQNKVIEDEDVARAGIPAAFREDHIAYIIGDDNGLARPESNITRAEVAMIFYRLLNDETRELYTTTENEFPDVDENDWYNTAVSTLNAMGIIYGKDDGTFAPDAYITRAEFAAIAARFDPIDPEDDDFFTDIDGHWAEVEILIAATKGWVEGYEGLFRPNDNITRAEAMTMVNRVLQRNPESVDDLLDNMIVWEDNMDTKKWYYLAVQEATNGHDYERKESGYEYWTALNNVSE